MFRFIASYKVIDLKKERTRIVVSPYPDNLHEAYHQAIECAINTTQDDELLVAIRLVTGNEEVNE